MRLSCLAVMLLLFSGAVHAEEQWSWIKVTNQVNGWRTSQGRANVTIDGENFEAQLLWDTQPAMVQLTLKGTIRKGKISVTETVHNSDYSGNKYSGTYSSRMFKGFADIPGVETVTFYDGMGMIGLTRKLAKK